ncbi:SWI/SNF chromatin-remodeling complex subunit [Lobosporangium transversale]|uniref:Uncharacterized protein n=1 Tax=Lobosporangium transversale TaxID=64571 RepID=A0A1Y2GUH8_9FUNG|nr:hypothetical protein BCR41DRAFT_349408 [Lobosporangium transversale]KAF9899622.1 SWI/SNF chromatin-remodeling complex subunit [Lobosporangium transversale]ORZ23899.1 hypothetical protein BCR41DRAFT_349408 [Lobosporangium transversale]|eukprot:XP_021883713.1 hypothetical protein BCR41DRAFT_349408 [Lobosporangium transversale]
MELRVPQQQISRLGYSTVPDPSLQYSQPTLAHNRRPAMTASNSSSSSVDTAAQVKFVVVENLPESLAQDKARLHQLYPSDHFEIRVRVGSASEGAINTGEVSIADYRVRCLDCPPGKLYNAGPDGTLQNFEVHLKSNRAHRSYVEQKKLQGNQQGSSHPPQLQSQLQSQPQSQSQPQPHPQPQPHLHHPMLPYSLPQSHQNLSLSPSMLNS